MRHLSQTTQKRKLPVRIYPRLGSPTPEEPTGDPHLTLNPV